MRWAACIEYDGSAYSGWQSQPHAPSVQDSLEAALSRVADEPVRTVCSGRTDSGVHAQGQIVHFDTRAERRDRSWLLGTNRWLADDIAPQWFVPVPETFHARFNAIARDYRYWIIDRDAPSALWRNRVWHVHKRLDHEAMHAAAQGLVGRHDFSAFRAAGCQAKTPGSRCASCGSDAARRLGAHRCARQRLSASHGAQYRRYAGGGRARRGTSRRGWPICWTSGDRRRAGMTAPAAGLSLRRVHYPADIRLPEPPLDDAGW